MNKADYSAIARTYDKGRAISHENILMWLRPIERMHPGRRDLRVADLGCGTGRFTIPLAHDFGYDVTGVDSSEEMLAKARAKDTQRSVTWLKQDVESLSLPSSSFDAVFMSHLLHHLSSPPELLGRCHAVLKSDGSIHIRYGAIEQIANDVVHQFFPSSLEIDQERTPSISTVETWLRQSGFQGVQTVSMEQRTFTDAKQRLETVRLRSTSVLTLIGEDEYRTGLDKLACYVRENPDDEWLLHDEMALTSARRP